MFKIKGLLNRVYAARLPSIEDLEQILSLQKDEEIEELFAFADKVRKDFCGDGIILRGIIEFSNFCFRECSYCGLNKGNHKLERYRMDKGELFKAIEYLASFNIKTVVLQSGEDERLDVLWLTDVIKGIKSRFDMAVTLSVGERSADDYRLWRQSGADRYLLKIESSDAALYASMHPKMDFGKRLDRLGILRKLGYQIGSGNIIGLPGQTLKTIARDIIFFKRGDFDMIGIGPFIPHQYSRFAGLKEGDARISLKALALTRIVTKDAHIPATTALGNLDKDYRRDGLKCGANVLMLNFTPQPYRRLYEIYPHKEAVNEPADFCNSYIDNIAKDLGRFIDYSKADSLKGTDLRLAQETSLVGG
ncbi:MAG: [FeFe] hydrogenase H-cluster radical SAM maturase HydE [Candidatus Omnitrophica bacterium]|nr:[FeFe] hydrogenase H-cluster radical SAM maturase HydE [Candidatus Omnitrophota bacterium]